ncbi:hypothetical protein [Flavobacterium reichenbachii]|uniref:Extracellular endo-alpha-(1->5)-L-arabinanase C-terminal domain-containing protein n=1 Tax=Flavobacterium reichenbachii TaxID=362418 RepID=A0A085ZP93_9FLAO|nr:hypothetical protein [Flavobacterium reichenbachii]KFF06257.1 hypothetical protein IW19_12270 [Flavobacterium reichenbachii]OXB17528.1 hypothetical protein B0A68_04330 [Flavobacterium reichenbachii]
MRKLILAFIFLLGLTVHAQTSKELIGKWQLVKWTKNGKEKNIQEHFKTDQVFQIFNENGDFNSLIGEESHKAKWELSKDNSELTIVSVLIPVKFKIDYFDSQKRIITSPQVGTFEYKKVTE